MTTGLHIYTIYKNPSDYPDKYVVRLFVNSVATDIHSLHDTPDEARAPLRGLYCMDRHASDDPVIVETWL